MAFAIAVSVSTVRQHPADATMPGLRIMVAARVRICWRLSQRAIIRHVTVACVEAGLESAIGITDTDIGSTLRLLAGTASGKHLVTGLSVYAARHLLPIRQTRSLRAQTRHRRRRCYYHFCLYRCATLCCSGAAVSCYIYKVSIVLKCSCGYGVCQPPCAGYPFSFC